MRSRTQQASFFLQIADACCRINTTDKSLTKYLKEELNYGNKIKPVFIEVTIEKHGDNLTFITRRSKTELKIPRKIKLSSNYLDYIDYVTKTIIGSQLLHKNILFLHASSIIKDGNAIIFMGPSTAGKTTVMKYFQKKDRLSNDTTIIKKKNNSYFVYPSPFDAKSGINAPKKYVPLQKIFVLKKSTQTIIKKIGPKQQILNIMENSLSFPKIYDKNDKISKIEKNTYNIFFKKTIDLLGKINLSEIHFQKNNKFVSLL